MREPGPYSARVRRAIALQKHIAGRFTSDGFPPRVRFVGGADIAFAPADARTPSGRTGSAGSPAIAIAVVYDLERRQIVEQRYARRRVTLPYVPGLLSFREEPILRAALGRIQTPVDLWMFDGHGRAHPRGAGLATHLGVRLGLVSIGVAKSLLVGRIARACHDHVLPDGRVIRGRPVVHAGQVIAEGLWTRPDEAPIFVSCGQHVTLEQALATVLACVGSDRLPAPTHVADALGRHVRQLNARVARRLVEAAASAETMR